VDYALLEKIMRNVQLGEIIAERKFKSLDKFSQSQDIVLRVGKPQQLNVRRWVCPFQFTGIGTAEIIVGPSGVDSLHALVKVLGMAQVLLIRFAKDEQKTITWLGKEELGFSMKVQP
jgi:hypothetical protein